MNKMITKTPILILLTVLWSSAVKAALITSPDDPYLFRATVDDFSSYATGDPLSISDGNFTMTQNGGIALNVTDNFDGLNGIVGRSVVSYVGSGIKVTFAIAVSAFGIHIGAADVGVVWTLEAFSSVGTLLGSGTVEADLNDRTNGFFMGWSDVNIGSVVLTQSSTDNAIFDNLHYVTASVPETSATLSPLSHAIEFPADGGSGPVIWYETARMPNLGSDANTLVLTNHGAMIDERVDFFGTPGDAFGLAGDQTQGAEIVGSEETTYLTGEEATVVIMFQTPSILTTTAAILGRRPSEANVGEPKFEVSILSDRTLQLTTGDTQLGVNTSIGTLALDTWYYLMVTWDLGLPGNQVSWYLGKMGESTLSRGFINQVSVVGNTNNAISVAGRSASDLFFGSYQNIAIYDRHLGENAVKDQFLRAKALWITNFEFQPETSPNTMLRWTDFSAVYKLVATDVLPFGDGSNMVIQVNSTNGLIDTESYPEEVLFSFTDPGATGSNRFWSVQIDLDESSIFIDAPRNSASLQAEIDSLNNVGVINITGNMIIDTSITIPSGIELNIQEGGNFNIQDGAFLTIEGNVSAGLYTIFNGIVTFVEGSVETVKSEWWGSNDYAVNLALLSAGTIPVKVTDDITVDSALLMNSNQTLTMYDATIFPAAPMTGGAVLKNRTSGATNLTVLGGTINGTAESTVAYDAIMFTNVNNSLIKDVTCTNVHIRSSTDSGNIHLIDSSYTTIEDCDVYGTWKMGIKIDRGNHNTILGGYYYGTHDSGIGAIDSPYLLIDGVYVNNCGTSDASNIAANLQYATMRNSICINGAGTDNGNGITIGHPGYPGIEAICENNLFINHAAKGVFLQGPTTRDIIVRNNIILDNGVGSSGPNSAGVGFYYGIEDSVIIDNEILGNRQGISFEQTSENNIVENNRIKSSTLYGVRSEGINNTLKDNILANDVNVLNGVNEVNLIKINNTETGEEVLDYSYLLDLPLTDLQRSVLTEYLD
jgi:hypothetical protein